MLQETNFGGIISLEGTATCRQRNFPFIKRVANIADDIFTNF